MKRTDDVLNLRDRSDAELLDELAKTRRDMFKFRTDVALRTLADVKSIRTAKKRVARILTLARERELAGGEG